MKKRLLFLVFIALQTTTVGCSNALEKTYTITFDSNGGSAVESIKVKEGKRIPMPNNPSFNNIHGSFSSWELIDGSVEYDTTQKYVDGQPEEWWNSYLGDSYPYLAYSDLTFKASWYMEKTNFEVWYHSSSQGQELESALNNYEFDDSYYQSITYEYQFMVRYAVELALASHKAPDIFLWNYDLMNDDGLHDVEQEIKSICKPLSSENKEWVEANFEKTVYNHLVIENDIYGIPFPFSETNSQGKVTEGFRFVCITNADYYPSNRFVETQKIAKNIAEAFKKQ